MKPKKLYKRLKAGELFENGVLWRVDGLRKRMVRRIPRFKKHKGKEEE